MKKVIMVLLAVVLIFSALGTAATVAYADGGEEDVDGLSFPIKNWVEFEIIWNYTIEYMTMSYGGAFCGSSCG